MTRGAGLQDYLSSLGTLWNIVYETPREQKIRERKWEGGRLHATQNLGGKG